MRYYNIISIIFVALNKGYFATGRHLLYDYKRLCEEVLQNCKYELITLPVINVKSLSDFIDKKENDKNDWFVEIKTQQSTVNLGELDNFLTPRPWWTVREQPHSLISSSTQQSIVLQRLPAKSLDSSRFIAKINFPSDNLTCQSRPAFVSAQTGTWGNGLLNMQGQYAHFARAVFIPLSTQSGNKNDKVFLADESACPDIVNKWECLFLPPTTCPWPDIMTNCHSQGCLPIDDRGFLSSASTSGVVIKQTELSEKLNSFPAPDKSQTVVAGTVYHSSDPYTVSPATSKTTSRGGGEVLESHFLYGVATRFNHRFRELVQVLIDDFRSTRTPAFHPNMSCVAVHIRRDDRALPGENMFDWCKTHTILNAKGEMKETGRWIDGSHLSSGQWMDMGCNKKVPFGAASLEHFLNASRVLMPENRNVFIMTDDPKWLKTEARKYYATRRHHGGSRTSLTDTMNIFTPTIRPNHRGGTFNSSIDFWASITMARQCQGVVGHLGSAAFLVIYNNLCYFHDNRFFECPPLYNIAGE